VTLSNYSGTTYRDAKLKLVAGDVNRVPDYKLMRAVEATPEPMQVPGMDGGFAEQQFFEYHLYDLQRPTTIRNNQQKQVGLLSAQNVAVKKIYELDASYQQEKASVAVKVEIENRAENKLGMPLPAGIVRVYKEDQSGAPTFAGEDRIQHTARNDKLRLAIGNAFDINGEVIQTGYKDLGDGHLTGWKVIVKNRKETETVTVRVVNRGLWGDWEIQDNSGPKFEKENATTAAWNVNVAADSELTFTYSLRVWHKPRQIEIVNPR
jgi:hypothetical protein